LGVLTSILRERLAATPRDAADQDVQEHGSATENHFCHLTSIFKTRRLHSPV
jgi:hypothetical protein